MTSYTQHLLYGNNRATYPVSYVVYKNHEKNNKKIN